MEGDDEMRTLECLRGRLIAERAASKIARETAELMEIKLAELEKQMKAEMKHKRKAEKKLNFLKKKVESLKLDHVLKGLETSNCSNFIESSCGSSSTVGENSEENQNDNPKSSVSVACRDKEINLSSVEITSSQESSSPDRNSFDGSHISDYNVDRLQNSSEPESDQSFKDPNDDDDNLKSYVGVKEMDQENASVEDDGRVDNSLALVLVPPNLEVQHSHKDQMKMVNKSVDEVLDALRLAKEKLQSSMDRTSVIQLGFIGTQICS